ncbi:hypothetical protein [Nocardioides sp. SYSU D00038]|uniref:hypothetical protein n=1 Tax=Nocardioides sp. SYSU D00038 TaxID=2812554 RepID=UPI001967A8F3|nr:hypothetical protein [Nocardioides sp. SYSU D00038]
MTTLLAVRPPRAAALAAAGVAVGLVAVLVAVLAWPATDARANADVGSAELSRDRVSWGTSLEPEPLLSPDLEWWAGDERSVTWWVRNTGTSTTDVDVVIARTAAPTPLAEGQLSLAARAGRGEWTVFTAQDDVVVVPVRDLAPSATAEVTLRGWLGPQSAPAVVPVDQLTFTAELVAPDTRRVGEPVGRDNANLELIPVFLTAALLLLAVTWWTTRRWRHRPVDGSDSYLV